MRFSYSNEILIITARRYAKRGIYRRRVSVCLSVTLQYCIKMAKRRIMQITHNSPETLSFLVPKIIAKFEHYHPLFGHQNSWDRLKSAIFDE